MSEHCGFVEAWIGPCKNSKPCGKHVNERCCSCKEPATRTCDETGQFVCGAPLCDECDHLTFEDGTNGGIGFNQQPVPEGLKRHVRKKDQRFAPWWEKLSKEPQE